ncbi:MAG: copper chaperone PCu(A)C [Actinomycetota bacterium]
MFTPSPRFRLVAGAAGLALVAAACGSDSGGVEASGAWARTSPMNAEAGAAYMVLSSDEQVTITSAEVSSDVAGRVELHETVPVEHDMDDMDDGDTMEEDAMAEGDMADGDMDEGEGDAMEDMGDMAMTMQELTDGLVIPADGEVALEPGGLHLMMLDLAAPLESGDTFDLTLNTDDGESITVSVEVRDDAP